MNTKSVFNPVVDDDTFRFPVVSPKSLKRRITKITEKKPARNTAIITFRVYFFFFLPGEVVS